MDEIRISYREVLIYLAIANAILGVLFGIFPLLAGLKLNNRKYGVIGFIGSILGGAIAGIFLSFPVAAVSSWLIIRKSSVNKTQDVGANDYSIDDPTMTYPAQ